MGLTDFVFKFPQHMDKDAPRRRNSMAIESDRAPSSIPGSIPSGIHSRKHRHTFKSYRLRGEYIQPWRDDKRLKRTKYSNIIIWVFILLSFCLCGYMTYDGVKAGTDGDYCLIMDDNFNGIDDANWSHEVQTGGFGNAAFDWTTTDKANSFTDAEGLHIVPTLTTESTGITEEQLLNGYTLNTTRTGDGDGSCTSDDYLQCSIRSNSTTGLIVPPVRSARLTTRGKKSIKYGRVEVTAKMPRGDWLWPAIWMMPEDSVYGPWPASGEIDIVETRGNDWQYPMGRNAMTSTLHWGPTPKTDAYWSAYSTKHLRRTDYSKEYHTFGLTWSEKFLYTYLDSKLKTVYYIKFNEKTMWERGYFQGATVNDSVIENPWAKTGRTNTPFDENFYLILNVAVGAQNGWFYDGKFDKPWVDGSPTAARDFWKAKDQWLPTWGEGTDRGLSVKSVKMWREGKC